MTVTTAPAPIGEALATRRPSPAIVVAGLLGGAATTSGIALTATSGWLIVRASERPVILTLLTAIVAVRTFGIARPFFRYIERIRSHDAALDDLARRRTSVYAALIPLTPARLGRATRAQVLTGVVDDLTDTVEAQVRVSVPVLSSVVAGLLAVGLTAWLWPPVGFVLAGLLVVLALACWLAWRLESRSQDELLAARAEVLRVSDLVARQADEVRAVGGQARALGWIDAAHDVWRAAVRRQSYGRALVAATILTGTGAATVIAAYLALGADVSAPVAALLVVVPVAVGDALAPLTEAMRSLARADGSAARLTGLLTQEPAVAGAGTEALSASLAATGPGHASRGPHLTLRDVTASWTGARTDLPPTSLDLPPGRRVAIVGANGSGKSTLLAVLARFLDPTAGTYLVDGHDALDLDLDAVRALIAVVDDEPHVFAATVAANLRVAAPDASDDALVAALAGAGLRGWLDGLPAGLDTRLGIGGRGLSGGERARLGLARALVSERPVILLDEPVAHLDHATASAIIHDLTDATRGRTVVMVSHRPEGQAAFDSVLDLTPSLDR
ncbi:MAG TPA: thiol reductant ABC exporter subunit CydC [Phycicoccus sp.]|nr:thiol reductant ABC exporter subunit CydC [Phycicoccus sp.]